MRLALCISTAFLFAACAKPAAPAPDASAGGVAATGRALFVEKGCVMCHSINGVGGKAGPVLDVADDYVKPNALEFAARIWRGAPAMVEFQSLELGYVIDLSGEDLAHLAAFAASREEQKQLDESAVPEPMRDSLLNERFWETEDWSEFLENGQEGYGDPAPPAGEGEAPQADPEPNPQP